MGYGVDVLLNWRVLSLLEVTDSPFAALYCTVALADTNDPRWSPGLVLEAVIELRHQSLLSCWFYSLDTPDLPAVVDPCDWYVRERAKRYLPGLLSATPPEMAVDEVGLMLSISQAGRHELRSLERLACQRGDRGEA